MRPRAEITPKWWSGDGAPLSPGTRKIPELTAKAIRKQLVMTETRKGDEMKVTAHAVRSGDWWSVDVPEVDGLFTQARRLDQIPAMVADAGELLTDIPAADFEVTLDYDFDPTARREIEEVKQLNAAAQRAVDEASRQSRAVVHDLRQRGLSVREIGVMLGITPSRVSQLGKDKATA